MAGAALEVVGGISFRSLGVARVGFEDGTSAPPRPVSSAPTNNEFNRRS